MTHTVTHTVHQAPMPAPRQPLTSQQTELIARVQSRLSGQPDLAALFAQCYPNTWQTTLDHLPGGRVFVQTGDIPAMWLRDSAAQVSPYLPLCATDPEVREVVAGVIRQHAHLLEVDPYANAYNREPGAEYQFDRPAPGPWVWERKFELDSLCFPLWLAWRFWQVTGDVPLDLRPTVEAVLDVLHAEQDHDARSAYTFERPTEYCVLPTDTLVRGGRGPEHRPTGMVWSGFRPSDDACTYPYLVPANAFAAAALDGVAALVGTAYGDHDLARRCAALGGEIRRGIETHGVTEHPVHGRVYAYETDGLGHHLFMDDANVPSLLSLPYLGYCGPTDPTYLNTRRLILSGENPHYHAGTHAAGISSPHTPGRRVWPIALCMQALTADALTPEGRAEIHALLGTLAATTAGTGLMHESFNPDDPAEFSRPWFAWANSLLAETVLTHLDILAERA